MIFRLTKTANKLSVHVEVPPLLLAKTLAALAGLAGAGWTMFG